MSSHWKFQKVPKPKLNKGMVLPRQKTDSAQVELDTSKLSYFDVQGDNIAYA